MPKFRKIPVEIDAWRWTPPELIQPVPEWLGAAIDTCRIVIDLGIKTATLARPIGSVIAHHGDWLIREENGDLDVCCNVDFVKLYQPAVPGVFVPEGLEFSDADLLQDGHITWMAPRDAELRSGPLDPATPMCEYCGARVFDPCSGKHPGDADSVNCQLPPGTVYVDDRRKNLIGGPGVAMSMDDPAHPSNRDAAFLVALTSTINSHSRENGSDTPDFILGQFLMTCLTAFDVAVSKRTKWYGGSEAMLERIHDLQAKLAVEGAHVEAGHAEIARLNTEIERITRRQQGELMGKG